MLTVIKFRKTGIGKVHKNSKNRTAMSIFTKDKLDALNNYTCQPKEDFVKKNNFYMVK